MNDMLKLRLRQGDLIGAVVPVGNEEQTVRCWQGIPYAQPPVGMGRWRPPGPAPHWSGVRAATLFGSDCPQPPGRPSRAPCAQEDCLYLNVWALPNAAIDSPCPLMVWVHGGGFVGGSGADPRCDGARMALDGVVVVTFNYRTGLLGYLAHRQLSRESADRVSGNYGLLDQMAALAWVQENIAAFGGDPSRVTVFGVSAGSTSISLLLVCPRARGLFQQAILHSPGAGRPLASLDEAERAGASLGEDMATLRSLSTNALLGLTPKLVPKVRALTAPRILRPIRDGWLLPEDERPALNTGRFHAMPIIVGSNSDEGSLLTASRPIDTLKDLQALIQSNFADGAEDATRYYLASSDADAHGKVAELFADTQFNYGTRLLAQAFCGREPRTWRYLFTRRAEGAKDGPHHGDEVAYVFGNLAPMIVEQTDLVANEKTPRYADADHCVSTAMRLAWVQFAKTADPNGPHCVQWPRYRCAQDLALEFGDELRVHARWRADKLDFLERFFADRG